MNKTPEEIKKAWETPKEAKFIRECELRFGKYKKIVLITTGKSYRVPTRDILTIGIKGSDLSKYPEWRNNEN